ncbi:MAG: glycosyltransferase [Planctomycetes bacterium]|nr:glycosyltransferase [Planctomycetota bacterium]
MTQEAPAGSAPSPVPRVSVVIPTFNRRELLSRCLDALAHQTLPPDQFEVIVVDDGSTDGTAARLEERVASGPMRLLALVQANAGPAAARNRGIAATRAPIVAFTDDDAVPGPGWLAAGLAALDDPTVSAVEGRVTPGEGARIGLFDAWLANESGGRFVTCNMFYRTVVLRTVGGFDERFREAFREDSDLAFHCLDRGFTIRFVPEAVVEHPPRPAGWTKFLRQARLYRYDALLKRKHPEAYRARIGRGLGWPQALFGLAFLAEVFVMLFGVGLHALLGIGLAPEYFTYFVSKIAPGCLIDSAVVMLLADVWWVARESRGVRADPVALLLAFVQFPVSATLHCSAVLAGGIEAPGVPRSPQ